MRDFRLRGSSPFGPGVKPPFGPPGHFSQGVQLPPLVATVGVNAITATSATLIGSVNPEGTATNWWFTYGPTTAMSLSTPVLSAGSGTVPTTVTASITGLTNGTAYYFAVIGQSAAGTAFGNALVFTATAPAQPVSPPVVPFGQ